MALLFVYLLFLYVLAVLINTQTPDYQSVDRRTQVWRAPRSVRKESSFPDVVFFIPRTAKRWVCREQYHEYFPHTIERMLTRGQVRKATKYYHARNYTRANPNTTW